MYYPYFVGAMLASSLSEAYGAFWIAIVFAWLYFAFKKGYGSS